MGAAASTNVRQRLEYITKLEAEVEILKAQKDESLKKVVVSQSEKENISVQSLRNRISAGQQKKDKILAEEQAQVDRAHFEAKVAQAKANEEHALLLLKELRADHELLKLELMTTKIKAEADVKSLLRTNSKLKAEKEFTVKTLVSNYDNLVSQLQEAAIKFREEVIDFQTHIIELADGLKVKQIKIDTSDDLNKRQQELEDFMGVAIPKIVLPAKDFLLEDPEWAQTLRDALRGGKPDHWDEGAEKARVILGDVDVQEAVGLHAANKKASGPSRNSKQQESEEIVTKESAEVELTLDADFADIPDGTQERKDFEANVIADIARSLGVPVECIEIDDINPGSIRVKFKIRGDRTDIAQRDSGTLAHELAQQATDSSSALMQGLITGSTKRIDVHSIPESSAMSTKEVQSEVGLAVQTPRSVVIQQPKRLTPDKISPRGQESKSDTESLGSNSRPQSVTAVPAQTVHSDHSANVSSERPKGPHQVEESVEDALHQLHIETAGNIQQKLSPGERTPDSLGASPAASPKGQLEQVQTSVVGNSMQSMLLAQPELPSTAADMSQSVAELVNDRGADSEAIFATPSRAAATPVFGFGDTNTTEIDAQESLIASPSAGTKLSTVTDSQRKSIEERRLRRAKLRDKYNPQAAIDPIQVDNSSALTSPTPLPRPVASPDSKPTVTIKEENLAAKAAMDTMNRLEQARAVASGDLADFLDDDWVDPFDSFVSTKGKEDIDDRFETYGEMSVSRDHHARALIMSTYRDFMEERLMLKNKVWDELHHLAVERGIAFCPVDQLWGIGNDRVANSQEVLRHMYGEIHNVFYFVFLLGGTYGWVPSIDKVAVETKRYDWLASFRQEHSYHASVHEVAFYRGVFLNVDGMKGRAWFYFRDKHYADTFVEDIKPHFYEQVDERQGLLAVMQERMEQTYLPVMENYQTPESATRQIKSDLEEAILKHFDLKNDSETDFLCDVDAQSASIAAMSLEFRGGRQVLARFIEHLSPRNAITYPLGIVGPKGGGKSCMIARIRRELRNLYPTAHWITYLVGSTNESRSYERLCLHIIRLLKRRFGLEDKEPTWVKPDSWSGMLLTWIGMAACKGRIIILIDGVDELDDREGALSLQWLPRSLPPECRMVLTTNAGLPADALRERGCPLVNLDVMQENDMLKQVMRAHMMRKGYSVNEVVRKQIAEKTSLHDESCLFLTVLLEETSQLAMNQHLKGVQTVDSYLTMMQADNLASLLDFVIWRWEGLYDRLWPGTIREVLTLVAASRFGLSEHEILRISPDMPRVALTHFLNCASYYFYWYRGFVNIRHAALRRAAESRFLPTRAERQAVHRRLGKYFRSLPLGRRRYDEEAWQFCRGEDWLSVQATLAYMPYFVALHSGHPGRTYDLRVIFLAADKHLDIATGLQHGLSKFEDTKPELSNAIDTTRRLAEFLVKMERLDVAADIYRTLLKFGISQHKSIEDTKENANEREDVFTRVAETEESLGDLQRQRWRNGVRDFQIINEARDLYESALDRREHLTKLYTERLQLAEEIATSKKSGQLEAYALTKAKVLHRESMIALNQDKGRIGSICTLQGDYAHAVSYLEEALEAFIGIFHPHHYSVAEMAENLAELFYHRRDYAKAETYGRKCVMVRHVCFGWRHPDFARALTLLASILRSEGNEYEADTLLRRAAAIRANFSSEEVLATNAQDEGRTMQRDTKGSSSTTGILK